VVLLTEHEYRVSIPYSSGKNCKSARRRLLFIKLESVSIPYSSGKNCKRKTSQLFPRFIDPVFQSLIHQGKIARVQALSKRQYGADEEFQSLIHQGKIARDTHSVERAGDDL